MPLSIKTITSCYRQLKYTLVLLAAFSATASAAVVSTLYQGEVPVASHSQTDWQKAIAPALWQVMVKVTGNPRLAQVDAVRKAVSKPESLVQSYNYSSLDQAGTSVLTLQVRFSPKAVDALLRAAGQTVISRDRPLTLVWLVMPDAQGQPQIAADPKDSVVAGLQTQADALALPILFPTLDLSSMSTSFAADVASFDEDSVMQASQRYEADNILVGNISKIPGSERWQVQWRWLAGFTAPAWQTQGATANVAVNAVLSSWVQQLAGTGAAAENSVTPATSDNTTSDSTATSQVVKMQVMGVRGLKDYTALMDYLKSSSLVTSIDTLQMNDTRLVLAIGLNGSRSAFIQALAAGNRLESQMADFGGGLTESSMLKYRWVNGDS